MKTIQIKTYYQKGIGIIGLLAFGFMIISPSCDSISKRTLVSTGLGCFIGLGLGAAYDEIQRKKEARDRKKDLLAIFKKKKKHNQGKIVGLTTGCLAGLGVGLYLDMMYEDIQNQFARKGIRLEKIQDEKGETRELLVKMDGDINFKLGSSQLQGIAKANVEKLREALQAYPETGVKIWGHTDKSGKRKYNEKLSYERAKSVANYLQLPSSRIIEVKGWAWDKPLDKTGKSPANRRVEIRIVPLG